MWCCSEMVHGFDWSDNVSSFPRRRKRFSTAQAGQSMAFALRSVIGEAFALARESLFFACAKKSNQKKAHPGGAPSALRAPGPQAGPEFSEGTSMCPPKTSRIVRAALRVYPSLLAASKGARNSNGKNKLHRVRGLPFPILYSPFRVTC